MRKRLNQTQDLTEYNRGEMGEITIPKIVYSIWLGRRDSNRSN